MLNDVETIRQVTRVALTIVAIPVTAFPLLYLLLSPWYKSQLGRAMMLQSLSIAFAIDFSVAYQYWAFVNLEVLVLIRLFMFIFVGSASLYLTVVMIVLNFIRPKKVDDPDVGKPEQVPGGSPPVPE